MKNIESAVKDSVPQHGYVDPGFIDSSDFFKASLRTYATADESKDHIELSNPYPAHSRPTNNSAAVHGHHDWLDMACDWTSGAVDLTTQIVVGAGEKACKEVMEHPRDVALALTKDAALGVVIFGSASFVAGLGAAAATVGAVAVTADVLFYGTTFKGAYTAACDSITAAAASADAAGVLMNKSHHSQSEIEAARRDVKVKSGGATLEAVNVLLGRDSCSGRAR